MKRATVFLANGFEEVEALTAVDLLRRAGVEVTTAAVGGSVDICGAHGIPVKADTRIEDKDLAGEDLIVLPGGMPGTINLNEDAGVQKAVRKFADEGRLIGAICAAPSIVLGGNGYLEGKKACCYPGMEDGMKGANAGTDAVTVDLPFVTSRGVGTAIPFALALIGELLGKEKADEIAAQIVFR